ncbi:PspC domain-containing protein [Bifidobacterium samirii]|uniref:PspC domain-containing protein n=1 Tax=Bifidobacterium samirii TaxID=2306974 RepID=A0A430FX14_9BIFI|nr:PspC domain-containing protein [Bifidobacterium samirii]RSX58862.1 PspC domain-containing protein [Bifidobacterium samirii]
MNEKNDSGFFDWIRRGGIRRTDDRWLGGVCGGLARYFGISPVLMRAIMLVAGMMFGFGLCFYALAWFLLPDERDGVIVCERLFRGSWDWSFLGTVVMLLVALWMFPWAFLGTLGLGALALWILNTRELRRQRGYGGAVRYDAAAPYGGAVPPAGVGMPPAGGPTAAPGMTPRDGTHVPYPGGPAGMPTGAPTAMPNVPGPQSAGQTPGQTPGRAPAAGMPPADGPLTGAPRPSAQPTAQPTTQPSAPASPMASVTPAAFSPYATPRPSAPASSTFPSATPAAAAHPMTSPWVAPQPAPQPRRGRRRPAGPLIVTLTFGAILISIAALLMYCGIDLPSRVRVSSYWIGGVCVALGLLITVLGLRGRRAGGLIPIAWLAAFTAMAVMALNIGYSYVSTRFDALTASYRIVNVYSVKSQTSMVDGTAIKSRIWTIDDTDFESLEHGVWLRGSDYHTDEVTLDLTGFADGPSHKVALGDGSTTAQSSCPAGQINLAVTNARVTVLVPEGCSYAFGSTDTGYRMGGDMVGGIRSAMIGAFGVDIDVMSSMQSPIAHTWSCDDYPDYDYGYGYEYDDASDADADVPTECRWYQDWHQMPQESPELLVDPVAMISGQVTIRYPGDGPTSLKEDD